MPVPSPEAPSVPACGATVWLTGLSGAGKSTIAAASVGRLRADGVPALVLDGDVLRSGLNAGLGFAAADRAEAVRRAGEAALLLASSGVTAVVALISPYRADRDRARARHLEHGIAFIECHVDVPLQVAESRDPKGLYAQARAGRIPSFTGVSDPYEPPHSPELTLRTADESVDACAARVAEAVRRAMNAGCFP